MKKNELGKKERIKNNLKESNLEKDHSKKDKQIKNVCSLRVAVNLIYEIESSRELKRTLKHGGSCIVNLDTMSNNTGEKTNITSLTKTMGKMGYYFIRTESKRNVFEIIKKR